MGGLSAAAGLAYRGLDVLAVEAHYRAGGYAHSFLRHKRLPETGRLGGFEFDAAVHLTPGGGPGEGLHRLLTDWGVADQVEFLPVQPMYRTVAPGLETLIASGMEGFLESHVRHFPHEREGFTNLLAAMDRMATEIRRLGEMEVPKDQMMRTMVRHCPTVLRYSSRSLQNLLDQHLKDPVAQSVVSTLWTYLGLPPTRCSAVAFSVMLMSFVHENAYYVRGSFQRLANAFVAALEKFGGELVMPRRVSRILLDEAGRAAGVELDKGERVRASAVISNVDAHQTFFDMVGRERLDADFAGSLERRPVSISAFEVFLAVQMDLKGMGVVHETFFAPGHDPEEVFDRHAAGDVFGCGISIPTIEDDTVAPPGFHTVCITMFAPWERVWKNDKVGLARRLVEEAEKVIPGLRRSVFFEEAGTPWTMNRYTGNHQGAIYGWDASPKSLATRLAMETPVPGLYLAGHWTRPGGGLYAVVTSGQIAADKVYQQLEAGRALCASL
jgi:phytoene dehydrogenase-like protein